MGIEVVWVGVESSKAAYEKLKGLDVKTIFESLHSHGINTLASLILGHDFHTLENIGDDLDYLVSLKPSLSQILILTPGCGTPLFDRLKKEGRLLDIPNKEWDGFHLAFVHPHISKKRMEELILEFYDEEFRRLGPSVIRFVEKQFIGYMRFKNTSDPLLRKRAEQYRLGCLNALPIFPTAIRHAPTEAVAWRIKDIQRSIVSEIGDGGLKNKVLAGIVPILAEVEKFKLRHFGYPQIKLKRTGYTMPMNSRQPLPVTGKGILTIKPRKPYATHYPLVVDLNGDFTMKTAKKLKKSIKVILNEKMGHLAINFRGVTSIEEDALFLFLKNLRDRNERIKIINIDSLEADINDTVNYAKSHFEVYTTIEGLKVSPA
jgi:anti-anti-sigma regulatory factor